MPRVQKGDSVFMLVDDTFEINLPHRPKGHVGRFLSRFYEPEFRLRLKVAKIAIQGGMTYVRLDVEECTHE